MSRRYLIPLAFGALLLGGVPALADSNGSTETTTETRSCSAPADSHYSAPGPNDCKNADGTSNPSGTYQATKWTNDVKCGSSNRLASQQGINVYAGGDPMGSGGNVGTCSDGNGAAASPVQGRAGLSGSTAQGARLTVDGDKDNGNETAQGYLVVEKSAGASAPSYRCGQAYNDGGKADTDTMEAGDTSEDCG
jgi:hypothetical protein